MENYCLVTKLKGSVNAELPKFGVFYLDVSSSDAPDIVAGSEPYIILGLGANTKVSAEGRTFKWKKLGDAYSYVEATECVIPNADIWQFIFPIGDYKVSFSNKYNITTIQTFINHNTNFYSFDVSQLNYSPINRYDINKIGAYGNVKVDYDNITFLNLSDYGSPSKNNLEFNIDTLVNNIKISNIKVFSFQQRGKFSGSINNLKSPVLTSLIINETDITGDINTMIQNMVAAGRTDGRFYTQGNNLITVNGTPFNDFRNSLPGSGIGINFTIDLTAPNNWTAARGI